MPFDETRENVVIELLRCGDGVGSSRALLGGGATGGGRCPGLTSFPSGGSRRDSPVSAASAARFRAALWSRSRTRPHVRHTYVRCERASLPFAVPHPEQVFELQKVAIGHTRHNRGGNPRPSRRGARQEPSKAKKRRPPRTMDVYGCHEGGRAPQAPPSGRRNPIAGVAGHKMITVTAHGHGRPCGLPHQGPLAAARRNMTR